MRSTQDREVRHDLRGSEHECPTQERDGHDRHDQRARRAHRATDDLGSEVGQPRVAIPAAGTIVERRQQDPLVEVVRRSGKREGAQQPEHARAAADLGRARGAAFDVGGQARRIGRDQVIEQEQIDELTGVRAVQGGADVRVRHITYMT